MYLKADAMKELKPKRRQRVKTFLEYTIFCCCCSETELKAESSKLKVLC